MYVDGLVIEQEHVMFTFVLMVFALTVASIGMYGIMMDETNAIVCGVLSICGNYQVYVCMYVNECMGMNVWACKCVYKCMYVYTCS